MYLEHNDVSALATVPHIINLSSSRAKRGDPDTVTVRCGLIAGLPRRHLVAPRNDVGKKFNSLFMSVFTAETCI